jgi:hypothetical protein
MERGCPGKTNAPPFVVMAGLVPAFHAVRKPPTSKVSRNGTAWMAGTSPAKTPIGSIPLRFSRVAGLFSATGQPRRKAWHDVPGSQSSAEASAFTLTAHGRLVSWRNAAPRFS